jgi:uncharacterized membrane protein YecN with MAPEG domain
VTFYPPYVTFLYTGLFGLLYFALTAYVVRHRMLEKKMFGHDTDVNSKLHRAVRIHANFNEYVPFILFMMALDEMSGRSIPMVHAFGIALIIGRLSHFIGLRSTHGKSLPRAIGAALTFLVLLILSVLLIYKGLV